MKKILSAAIAIPLFTIFFTMPGETVHATCEDDCQATIDACSEGCGFSPFCLRQCMSYYSYCISSCNVTTTTTIATTAVPTTTTTVICDSGSTVDADGDGKIDFLSSCCSNANGNCDYNDAQYDGTVLYIINSDGTQEVRKTYADVSFNAVTPVFHPTRDLTRNYCTNLSWGGIDTWLPLDELDIWKLASADYPFESNCSNYPDGCHIFSTSWSSKTVWTQPPSPWNAHLDLSLMYNQNWYRGWILKGCNGNELTANCNYWFAIRESDVYSYPKYETDPRWPTAQPMVICKANVSISTTTTVPTLIELSSFTATPKAGKVIVEWSTESEIDNAGFNLYRSESADGEYIKLNTSLIPAKGSSTQGATYEFVDTDVQNRKTYYYKLEDIDLTGTSTMHGPVSATPRLIYGNK
ncbi:MAG: hypothetical protein NTV89_14350 [Proteobacteria bacterium]|nr:hypothetical protein [Pseudomonadota bacterium]